MPDNDASDLTGVWDGVFSYPVRLPPTPFTAVLIETGSALSGSIHEQPQNSPVLTSTLEGGRSGGSVTFKKVYDPSSGRKHFVLYTGVLSPDGNEIEGRWSIPRQWSGRFVMTRAPRKSIAVKARRRVAVPAT